MHKYLFAVFIAFWSLGATAQTSTIDSLLSRLENEKTDSTIADVYIELGYQYININTDTSILYFNKARGIALEAELDDLIGDSYYGLGYAYLIQNNYSESFNAYEKSLGIWEKSNNQTKICWTTSNIGNIFRTKGELIKANDYYLKAAKMAEEIDDTFSYSGLCVNIGLIFNDLNNSEKALEYFNKALVGFQELNYDNGISICYQNIGLCYQEQSEYNEAIQYYNKALEITVKNNNQRSTARLYNKLGSINESLGNLDIAMNHYNKSYSIFKKVGDNKSMAESLLNRASVNSLLKKYDESIKHSHAALDIGIETQTLDIQSTAYEKLASAYEESKQYNKALKYHKQFKMLNDSIFSTNMSKQIIEMQTKFETDKKEKENELLKIDNELQAYEIKQHHFRSYILYGSVFLFLVLFLIAYKQVRVKKKINFELQTKNEVIQKQQEELSEALILMKELNEKLETQKLDLHDQAVILKEANSTKNKFFSIIAHDLKNPFNSILGFSELLSSNYQRISDTKRREYIQVIKNSVNKTYDLLCNLLIWANSQLNRIEIVKEELNLANLIIDSIQPYLVNADAKKLIVQNNISADYFVNVDKYTISTVFGNLFTNAVKFTSEGGSIIFDATIDTNYYKISIKDTGVGMSDEVIKKLFSIAENQSTEGTNNEHGSGLGLLLCKEFVEKNNGKIEIISKEGEGSTFTVLIPKV